MAVYSAEILAEMSDEDIDILYIRVGAEIDRRHSQVK